jgi:hypothetical protein
LYKKLQKLLLYICILLISARCAQITPLTGGKKDVDPPKVLESNPPNASLNFTTTVIDIRFDEYIVLKDVANQLIITPQTKELPEVEANGKKLRIKFNEALLPNTTYKLAFGNSITDLRESNILPDYQYVFSTGNVLDSMTLGGQVVNAFDKKPEANLLVGLYPPDAADSIIYKEKPLYITKTGGDGSFHLDYLPEKPFRLIAIKDQNKNLLYDGSEERIAFSDSLVNPGDSVPVSMLLFKEVPVKSFIRKSTSLEYGKAYIIYNKPQTAITDVKANGLILYTQNPQKDSLTLYYANKVDTLVTYVSYSSAKQDTAYIKIPSKSSVEKLRKNNAIRYSFTTNLINTMPYYELPRFELNFPVEGKNIHEAGISLTDLKDSSKTGMPFTLLKNGEPATAFTVQAVFREEGDYKLVIDKGAFTNSDGRTNDSIAYKFTTSTKDDYAQLNMKLLFPKKEKYIVMLLNEKEMIINETGVEFSLTSTSEKLITYKNLLPGNYFIKVVEDANKNGHFDVGDFFIHQQPEPVFINPTPIKLLAGWEIENEWIIK